MERVICDSYSKGEKLLSAAERSKKLDAVKECKEKEELRYGE